uniref:Ig-like domain-containing protein n=1 Tax=Xiphophorus couchianus TaxID=32473 RepID=A0A3B5LFB5_9TELE
MKLQLIVFLVLVQGEFTFNTFSPLKLELILLLYFVTVSLAEKMQNVTALKGSTVDLRCPISKSDKGIVEWRDPDNNIMFFNDISAIKDKRYSITKLTNSQFSISITNVTFTDGGVYTCTQYKPKLSVKTVRVTVLGEEGEKSAVKCTAKGNNQPPKITWKLKNEPEFQSILYVYPENSRVTVKCLVHHPDLHAGPLMQFVKVGKQSEFLTSLAIFVNYLQAVKIFPLTGGFIETCLQESTSPINWNICGTVKMLTASDPKTFTVTPAGPSVEPATSVHLHFNTTGRTERKQSSSLLVLLVTCLIFALLVVVIFFAIKLRRAHIAWKKGDMVLSLSLFLILKKSLIVKFSVYFTGLFNTVFAQYVVEDPAAITSVTNPNAMTRKESATIEQTSQSQTQAAVRSNIKETSL